MSFHHNYWISTKTENIPLKFEIFRYLTEEDWPVLERRMAEECNGHLVFLLLMIGCFKEGKERADDLVFSF